MVRRTIRSGLAAAALLGLAACQMPATGSAVGSAGSSQAAPAQQAADIGGLSARPLSVADLQTMGPVDYAGYYLPIKPGFQGPDSSARQLTSGNFTFESRFPVPAEFGETAVLQTVRAADLPALQAGMEAGYVEQTIRPVVRAWAADGALYTAYSKMPPRFGDSPPRPDMGTEAAILQIKGWPLAYLSKARREVLFCFPSGLVVLTGWQARDLDETTVKVPKPAAIDRYVAAMRDPGFKSEEALTGRDYFLGVPYAGTFPPPEHNNHDDLVPAYDFPDTVKWDATFVYQFAGKPVWLIHAAAGGGFGSGWLDAQTGTIIRFQRPRQGYIVGPFVPSPMVLPSTD